MQDPSIQLVIIQFVKFVFFRYAPSQTPTDQQIINALQDFRQEQSAREGKHNGTS